MKEFEYANASWLTEDVATGGDISMDDDLAVNQAMEIVDAGITHVFDSRIEASDEDVWEALPQITYVNKGTDDAEGHHIPAELFDAAVDFARQCEEKGGKVLIHCHMGINRGPSLAAAVLMDRGWEPIAALELIQNKRPQAGVYYFLDAYKAHVARVKRETGMKVTVKRDIVRKAEDILGDPALHQHVMAAIDAHRIEDERAFNAMMEKED